VIFFAVIATFPKSIRSRHKTRRTMIPNEQIAAQHNRLAEVLRSLANMQFTMSRVKNVFPNYHQHLQQKYNQLLLEAKREHLLPPWMTI
jgi:hypothetical protein